MKIISNVISIRINNTVTHGVQLNGAFLLSFSVLVESELFIAGVFGACELME